jgi:hypothetical protein
MQLKKHIFKRSLKSTKKVKSEDCTFDMYQHLVSLQPEVKFKEIDREKLRSDFKLSPEIINEIEQAVSESMPCTDLCKKTPQTDTEQAAKAIEVLHNLISELLEHLHQVDPSTEYYINSKRFMSGKRPYAGAKKSLMKELKSFNSILAIPVQKRSVGNTELPSGLEYIFAAVKKVLNRHQSKFNIGGRNGIFELVDIVFKTIGQESSPRTTYDKHRQTIERLSALH